MINFSHAMAKIRQGTFFFFSMYMLNVDENPLGTEELLRRGAFSVARSFIPRNMCAIDKTIEETFEKVS